MADRESRIHGFLWSLVTFRDGVFWSLDFLAFLLVTLAAGYLPTDADIARLSESLATAAIALGAAMVGVVVAGLAVVVALLDDELLRIMDTDDASGGVPGHMFDYWFVTGTGVVAFLLGLALSLAQGAFSPVVDRALFAGAAGFVTWTALGVFNLVGGLQALGINRATAARRRGPRP